MIQVADDRYNGYILSCSNKQLDLDEAFKSALKDVIEDAKNKQKALLWLDLTVEQASYIAIALTLGFEFHNCEAKRTTLTYRIQEDTYVPVSPSHTIGVGAVVINKNNELLMVRDRIHNNHSIYKLPGGMLEHAQCLEEGVVREVWEETGVKAKLIKMVSLLNSHPYRFNKSNMYIVFQLEALTTEINVIDTHEIEEAIWMPLSEFFAHTEMSEFQKDLVNKALQCDGLKLMDNEDKYFKGKKHVEVYG